MSRYLERAEHAARVMGVHLNLMLEHDVDSAGGRWYRVLESLGSKDYVTDDPFAAAQLYALNQIVSSISAAREDARQVREQISSDMWEELNRLFHESKRRGMPEIFNYQPYEFFSMVMHNSFLFQGITDSTMLHGEGWEFIQAGRFIERVQQTARLIDTHFRGFFRNGNELINATDHMEWVGLLQSCTGFEAYCKVRTAELRPEWVADFLILSAEFPHSLRFAVDRLRGSLEAIHHATTTRKPDRLGKLAGRLTAALSFTPLDEIMNGLREFSRTILRLCGHIHNGIYQVYIAYPIEVALED
jgi:uncharacterized alpha-E superfamily protein